MLHMYTPLHWKLMCGIPDVHIKPHASFPLAVLCSSLSQHRTCTRTTPSICAGTLNQQQNNGGLPCPRTTALPCACTLHQQQDKGDLPCTRRTALTCACTLHQEQDKGGLHCTRTTALTCAGTLHQQQNNGSLSAPGWLSDSRSRCQPSP